MHLNITFNILSLETRSAPVKPFPVFALVLLNDTNTKSVTLSSRERVKKERKLHHIPQTETGRAVIPCHKLNSFVPSKILCPSSYHPLGNMVKECIEERLRDVKRQLYDYAYNTIICDVLKHRGKRFVIRGPYNWSIMKIFQTMQQNEGHFGKFLNKLART